VPRAPAPPGQRSYLTDAEYHLQIFLRSEVDLANPTAYAANYNNVGWGAEVGRAQGQGRAPSLAGGAGRCLRWAHRALVAEGAPDLGSRPAPLQLLLAEALDSNPYRLRVAQFLRGWMTGKVRRREAVGARARWRLRAAGAPPSLGSAGPGELAQGAGHETAVKQDGGVPSVAWDCLPSPRLPPCSRCRTTTATCCS
jgi:hypothetical protein